MWDLGHMTVRPAGHADRAYFARGGFGNAVHAHQLAAFSEFERPGNAQGASMINLMRQLGGSAGIAILSTYITNQTVFHKNMLSSHIYAGNPMVEERKQAIVGNLIAHGMSPAIAQNGWLGVLNGTVSKQAATMSYNDGFLLILVVFLFTAPAIFLLRPNKTGGGGGSAEVH